MCLELTLQDIQISTTETIHKQQKTKLNLQMLKRGFQTCHNFKAFYKLYNSTGGW